MSLLHKLYGRVSNFRHTVNALCVVQQLLTENFAHDNFAHTTAVDLLAAVVVISPHHHQERGDAKFVTGAYKCRVGSISDLLNIARCKHKISTKLLTLFQIS